MHRRRKRPRVIAAALLAAAAASLTAADPAGLVWGEPSDGLRLGIGAGPRGALRVAIENQGRIDRNIPLGSSGPGGAVYDFQFRVVAPDGNEKMLFDLNGPPGVARHPDPLIAHLAPGQSWDTLLQLDKFTVMLGGKEVKLPELLQQRYGAYVTLDTTQAARAERTRSEWVGRLRSGLLRR